MERPLVTAVTHSTDEARVTLTGVRDEPGVAGRIFGALADANVNVDMIIQNEPESEGAAADMSFTVPRADLPTARSALDPVVSDVGIFRVAEDPTMGKVSVVGAGMKSHPGVAAKRSRPGPTSTSASSGRSWSPERSRPGSRRSCSSARCARPVRPERPC